MQGIVHRLPLAVQPTGEPREASSLQRGLPGSNVVQAIPGVLLEWLWPIRCRNNGRLVCRALRELLVPGRAPRRECVVFVSWRKITVPTLDPQIRALVSLLRRCARDGIRVSFWIHGRE